MRLNNLHFLVLSLSAVAMLFPYSGAVAALRVSNSSLMQEQAALNAARAAAAQQSAQYANTPQPARTGTAVNNDTGASTSVSDADMDACNMIYPNGQFAWVQPTMGLKRGNPATCVSLVEMRSYQNSGGTQYTVLARGYLAAGDSAKCNIDDFSDITYQGRDFTYPADNPPTIEDVERVMAQENKSNAGFKILGAALVGGIGGNLLAQGDKGDDSALGLGGDKLKGTAIGAATAAAVMTASTQVDDYKAGSVILSTGVNAAAGAVVGNLMATGDDILKIDECEIEGKGKTTCLYGTQDVDNTSVKATKQENAFYNIDNNTTYVCTPIDDDETVVKEWKDCVAKPLVNLTFEKTPKSDNDVDAVELDGDCKPDSDTGYVTDDCIKKVLKAQNTGIQYYGYEENTDSKAKPKLQKLESRNNSYLEGKHNFVKIAKAASGAKRVGAMIEFKESQGMFGIKYSEWKKTYKAKQTGPVYDLQGKPLKVGDKPAEISKFYPIAQSPDDGAVVDFDNRARTKSTLIGTGVGGGLGALSGAMGADAAIQERWTTAVREYEDSLGNVVCVSGNRFMAKYNDILFVPEMSSQQ